MKNSIEELTAELNAFNAAREESKKKNATKDDFPKIKRSYKYRDSTKL